MPPGARRRKKSPTPRELRYLNRQLRELEPLLELAKASIRYTPAQKRLWVHFHHDHKEGYTWAEVEDLAQCFAARNNLDLPDWELRRQWVEEAGIHLDYNLWEHE